MSESFYNSSIDSELQVRLMNLVMGEASDFERDQLQLLMEQRPDLAAYCKHLEHLHGLLCEVGTGEPAVDVDPSQPNDKWQLSASRREQVLAVLEKQSPSATAKVTLAKTPLTKQRRSTIAYIALTSLATCALLGLMLPSSPLTWQLAKSVDAQRYYIAPETSYPSRPASPNTFSREFEINNDFDSVTVLTPSPEGYVDPPSQPSSASGPLGYQAEPTVPNGRSEVPSFKSNFEAGDKAASHWMMKRDNVQLFDSLATPAAGAEGASLEGQLEPGEASQRNRGFGLSGGGSSPPPTTPAAAGLSAIGGQKLNIAESDSRGSEGIETLAQQTAENAHGVRAGGGKGMGDGSEANKALWGESKVLSEELVPENKFANQPLAESFDDHVNLRDEAKSDTKPTANSAGRWFDNGLASGPDDLAGAPKPEGMEPTADDGRAVDSPKRMEAESLLPGITARGADKDLKQDVDFASPAAKEHLVEEDLTARKKDLSSEKDKLGVVTSPEQSGQVANLSQSPNQEVENLAKNFMHYRLLSKEVGVPSDGTKTKAATSLDEVIKGLRASLSDTEKTSGEEVESESQPNRLSIVDSESKSADQKLKREKVRAQPALSLEEQSAASEAFSTFSLHVSDVSFKLAQTALGQGQWPEAAKVRIEEFVNAIDYRDPLPAENQKVSCQVEQAIHPFLIQRNLLRISLRTAATGRSQSTPLRLTLLLDNSGSMERPDRRQAVLRAFQTLTQQLNGNDQLTLISFSSTPRLLADKIPGNQGEMLLQLVENLPSEGGTNIEAALQLAREKAREHYLAGAQNRIVLLTDGAVNLGNADPASLSKLVTQIRDDGIAFDAAGISVLDLNDEVLEALTRQGDGRYYLLDSAAAADESFAAQIAGALRPSAQNVKVQVEFNPQRVGQYKLLGFEKHRLNKEDFRNDQVDAAEMAAAEAGVAVYQFEIKPHGSGDVGSVSVRFRDLSTGEMVERRWPIPYEPSAPRLEKAEPSMQLAACAAMFAAKLGGGPLAESVDLAPLQNILANLPEQVATQPRVQQLRTMLEQAKAIEPQSR